MYKIALVFNTQADKGTLWIALSKIVATLSSFLFLEGELSLSESSEL